MLRPELAEHLSFRVDTYSFRHKGVPLFTQQNLSEIAFSILGKHPGRRELLERLVPSAPVFQRPGKSGRPAVAGGARKAFVWDLRGFLELSAAIDSDFHILRDLNGEAVANVLGYSLCELPPVKPWWQGGGQQPGEDGGDARGAGEESADEATPLLPPCEMWRRAAPVSRSGRAYPVGGREGPPHRISSAGEPPYEAARRAVAEGGGG